MRRAVSTSRTAGNNSDSAWEDNSDKLVSEDELYGRGGAKVAWTHCERHDCNTRVMRRRTTHSPKSCGEDLR
jgi:hypothetical protein